MIICTSAVGHIHTALAHAANEGVHAIPSQQPSADQAVLY